MKSIKKEVKRAQKTKAWPWRPDDSYELIHFFTLLFMLLELLSMRNTVDMPLLSQLKLVEMRPVAQKGWLKRQP